MEVQMPHRIKLQKTITSLKHQKKTLSLHITQYCIAIIVTCNYTSTMFQLSRSLMLCDATGGQQMNQTSGYIGSVVVDFRAVPSRKKKSLLQCYGHSAPPCPTNTMAFKDGVGSVLLSQNRHVTLLNWPHPNEFAVCVGWLSAPLDSSPAASDRSNMGIMEHWVRTRNINVIRDDSMAVCGTSDYSVFLRQRTRNGRNCQYQSNPKFIEIRLQKQTADVKLFMKDFLEYLPLPSNFPHMGERWLLLIVWPKVSRWTEDPLPLPHFQSSSVLFDNISHMLISFYNSGKRMLKNMTHVRTCLGVGVPPPRFGAVLQVKLYPINRKTARILRDPALQRNISNNRNRAWRRLRK